MPTNSRNQPEMRGLGSSNPPRSASQSGYRAALDRVTGNGNNFARVKSESSIRASSSILQGRPDFDYTTCFNGGYGGNGWMQELTI